MRQRGQHLVQCRAETGAAGTLRIKQRCKIERHRQGFEIQPQRFGQTGQGRIGLGQEVGVERLTIVETGFERSQRFDKIHHRGGVDGQGVEPLEIECCSNGVGGLLALFPRGRGQTKPDQPRQLALAGLAHAGCGFGLCRLGVEQGRKQAGRRIGVGVALCAIEGAGIRAGIGAADNGQV